jgi:FMN phosphatase YigB (HAD superfamily)
VPDGALVLDMDGTIVLGDDPVRVYAAAAAEALAPHGAGAATELLRVVDGFLAGDPTVAAPDGYQAVARTALRLGLSSAELDAAAERVFDAPDALALSAPPDLAPLLAELRPAVHVVVASNGSPSWMAVALDRVGARELVDEVHGSLRKPAGLERLVGELLDRFGWRDEPGRLLGVGDIWANDLAPIDAVGGVTALVDRWGRAGGSPTHAAATFGGLVPAIRRWAADLPTPAG